MKTTADLIADECNRLRDMLLTKNKAYGDSALNPLRIFSRASTDEQIRVRIDDKLSRLSRGQGKESEDVVQDLLGYLILLRIAQRQQTEVPIGKDQVTALSQEGFPRPVEEKIW